MSEVFKEIPGYEGIYEVSNLGRVKILPMEYESGGISNRSIRQKKENIMSSSINKQGYVRTCLTSIDGVRKSFLIHRLVAMAFIPLVPDSEFINHKNGIKSDNRAENLEWCTRSENICHAVRTGLKVAVKGGDNYNAISVAQMDLSGNIIKTFTSIAEASEELKIATQSIRKVIQGKWKQCYGFIFLKAS